MVKKIGGADIIGERGVAVIRKAILDIGSMCYETGGVESGIDGYIEIRDPKTGVVFNQILQFQSRATTKKLPGETDTDFYWPCSEDELSYWRGGTAPVILFVVELGPDRVYWKSIKDYFRTSENIASRRIVFDKGTDLLTSDSGPALALVAQNVVPGTPPLPNRATEELAINLLQVVAVAPYVYWAPTEHGTGRDFGAALRDLDRNAPSEWIVRSRSVLSFHRLDTDPWRRLCDAGAMEEFGTEEWSTSDDPDRQRQYVELLNRALSQMVRSELNYDKEQNCYFFRKPKNKDRLAISYRAVSKETAKVVVKRYHKKKNPKETAFWRHSAFRPRFHKFDGQWYLEVTPTYVFTQDGFEKSPFS